MGCQYGDILEGGGVYWGCRQQMLYTIDETGTHVFRGKVTFEKDVESGFGPEVVLFQNPPDGEYHITVTVQPTVPAGERDGLGKELLIGAEEVRVYFADGSFKSIYTSVRASQVWRPRARHREDVLVQNSCRVSCWYSQERILAA